MTFNLLKNLVLTGIIVITATNITSETGVIAEFIEIDTPIPQDAVWLTLNYGESMGEYYHPKTDGTGCNCGEFPFGDFKTMMYTIDPVDPGQNISISTNPPGLIVSANKRDNSEMMRFEYNFEAIANANEIGVLIKFPSDKLLGIFSYGIFGLYSEGISRTPSNLVQVNEGFGNLTDIIVSDTHIRVDMTTSDRIDAQISGNSMAIINATNSEGSSLDVENNSTAIYNGNLSYITCGFDFSMNDYFSGNDRSICIVGGGIVQDDVHYNNSVQNGAFLYTSSCTDIKEHGTGTCSEDMDVGKILEDSIENMYLTNEVYYSRTTNTTFSFCSPSSSATSSFPRIRAWFNVAMAFAVVVVILIRM